MDIQFIGADLGRGYVKGYTEFNGKPKTCLFKSIVGDGREIDFKVHNEPIFININNENCFIGEVAEKESYNPTPNYSDDKTSIVAEKLLFALLNELAEVENVKVCLGVPNKIFNKETLNDVINTYKDKKITIKDRIKNTTKEIVLKDITIFRESDAALLYAINNHKDRIKLQNQKVGMVTAGFRTTELSYFDKNMKFNDKLSKTLEIGNRTVLDIIQRELEGKGIMKELNEIDADSDYNNLKSALYDNLLENLNQKIEMSWINFKDMKIFIAGGTSKNFKNIPEKFEKVEDPQMITAKGLNFVAEMRLK